MQIFIKYQNGKIITLNFENNITTILDLKKILNCNDILLENIILDDNIKLTKEIFKDRILNIL